MSFFEVFYGEMVIADFWDFLIITTQKVLKSTIDVAEEEHFIYILFVKEDNVLINES